jgi:F-type H+-transporting ATPase subunit a
MILNSPLEQFEIIPLVPIEFKTVAGTFDISVTNFVLFLFFDFSIILFLLLLGTYKLKLLPNRLQLIIEGIYTFVVDTIKQQTGDEGLRFFIYYFLVFFLF